MSLYVCKVSYFMANKEFQTNKLDIVTFLGIDVCPTNFDSQINLSF